jgi:hypothetical protein
MNKQELKIPWKKVERVEALLKQASKDSRAAIAETLKDEGDDVLMAVCRIAVKRHLDNRPASGASGCKAEDGCSGTLTRRKNKARGNHFYGCNKYPRCRYTEPTAYEDQKQYRRMTASVGPYAEKPFYILFPEAILKSAKELRGGAG